MKYILALFTLCIAIFFSCKNTQVNTNKPAENFDKQAHRGGRGLWPENTIPAMINSIGWGVTTLEMDVVISKDKKVVLSHEPFFNHDITTKPDGSFIDEKDERNFNMYKINYSEIAKYDVGMKPHPRFPKQEKMRVSKPLLADVLDSVKIYMMMARRPFPFYNIETKTEVATDKIFHPGPAEFVDLLMQVIKEKGVEEQVIIQSFDMRTLQYLHKKYPSIKTALLVEAVNRNSFRKQIKDLGFIPTIYSPEQTLVTANLISECHARNIKIIPWTVNEKKKIRNFKEMGVDGVISDYPDLF